MSNYHLYVPSPDEHDYHEACQVERVRRAVKQIDPGDVLAVIDSRIAENPDPQAHPLFKMVCWALELQLTPLDGGEFYDQFKSLVLQAVDSCLDDMLEIMED